METTFKFPNESPATMLYVITAQDLKQFAVDIVKSVIDRMKNPDDETFMSRESVAELLGVTKATLWRWNKEKYLVGAHTGRKVRYCKSDVMRILKERGGANE